MTDKFFWADDIAEKIIKEKVGKSEYVCACGISPSGTIHMGNFREVITTELVVRALKDKGKKIRFIYSWDDYDRLRKVPMNIPENKKKEFENYIGMPISEIPSPFDKKLDYARYFEAQFEKDLKPMGIKPKFIRQSEMNKKCKYSSLIKTAIEKRKEIMDVLNKYRKEPLDENWTPLEVYCEKCKKDATKILNAKGYEIEYSCACGFRNKIDFRKKGIVKLKWRVDWPARWFYEKVDFEPGGADHSAPGGSFDTAKKISKKIFGYNPPIYQLYEWVRPKGGKEFSSSSGNALSLSDGLEVYEPEILRYLFVGTRPNKGFPIIFDDEIIKIYEEFDELERKYFEKIATPLENRIYELSLVKMRKTKPEKTSFRHLITLVQTGKTKNLKGKEKERAEKVRNWLDNYAPEEFKFKVQDKIPEDISLSDGQKKALNELKFALKNKNLTEEELYNKFYDICASVGLKNNEFFTAAYNVILNKNRGPRLANLIMTIGKEKIIKLLEQVR